MSKFEEMRAAAITAGNNWREYEDRCKRCISELVQGFAAYCEIPGNCIRLLRWDEQSQTYLQPAANEMYSIHGASVFDEKEGCWRLGLSVALAQAYSVAFGLTVNESGDGQWIVKAAGDKTGRRVSLSDSTQRNELYNDIVAKILASYKTTKASSERLIGFQP